MHIWTCVAVHMNMRTRLLLCASFPHVFRTVRLLSRLRPDSVLRAAARGLWQPGGRLLADAPLAHGVACA
eukprot:6207318-Pleurochrysis_carterae.AAC.1